MGIFKSVGAWVWNALGNIAMIVGWIGVSTLTGYAAKAAGIMSGYAPFSYVAIGIAGGLVSAVAYALIGIGKNFAVQAKARRRMLAAGDAVNPMDEIFVSKRIYISDFVNPFNQVVSGKKFIKCEIIGPGNLMPLLGGGKFLGNKFDHSDAVEMTPGVVPQNAVGFLQCDFEDCRFFKVTLIFQTIFREEANKLIKDLNWLTVDVVQDEVLQIEDQRDERTRLERFIRRFTGGNAET